MNSFVKPIFALAVLLPNACNSAVAQTAQTASSAIQAAPKHGPLVEKALAVSREPDLSVGKLGTFSSDQATRILEKFNEQYRHAHNEEKIIRDQKEQGISGQSAEGIEEMENVQIRNLDLFPSLGDDVLFPVTSATIFFAPESSFSGLTLYTNKGKPVARVAGKSKTWHPGQVRDRSFYTTNLLSEDGRFVTDGGTLLFARWGDLKNRIAFDMSARKAEQDRAMETAALTQAH